MDVITFGPDKPRRTFRRPPRRAVVIGLTAATCAALLVVGIAVVRGDGPAEPGTAAAPRSTSPVPASTAPARSEVPASEPCPAEPGMTGMVLDGLPAQGRTVEWCDSAAVNGPWAVVVRRHDGSLGRHGAVVTFPVGRPAGGLPVKVAGAAGVVTGGSVTWPLAGSYARIRGDLDQTELVAVASATAVRGGRPQVRPSRAYDVVWSGPYRAPAVRQARYGTVEVGEGDALGGGLTYTGLTSGGGGFEDQLYLRGAVPGGRVRGTPAMVSAVGGGNATLAWEMRAGMVAYVGYSGAMLDDDGMAALARLATRTRYLSPAEWRSSYPNTIYQVNEPG